MKVRARVLGTSEPSLVRAYRQARRYLDRSEVTGVAIGEAIRKGRPAGPGIVFLVDRKLSKKRLGRRRALPKCIGEIAVDVVQRKHVARGLPLKERLARRGQLASPAVPGVQIVCGNASLGTFGMLVVDTFVPGKELCVLTAGHVLDGAVGAPVYQPDGDVAVNRIGAVRRRILDRYCDAGLVVLDSVRHVANVPMGQPTRLQGCREVRLNEVLTKSGCMTGLTVAAVRQTGEFKLETPGSTDRPMAGFELLPIAPSSDEISDAGDSGSVWFDPLTGDAVGLTVAGDKGGAADQDEWALACHMPWVFERLGVECE